MGHTQENCYSLHGFPDKVAQVSRSKKAESKFSDEEYLSSIPCSWITKELAVKVIEQFNERVN